MVQKLNCYLDTEWGSDGTPISLQVLFGYEGVPNRSYCVVNQKYERYLALVGIVGDYNHNYNTFFSFSTFPGGSDLLTQLVQSFLDDSGLYKKHSVFEVNLYFFYSPKDLSIGFGSFLFDWLLNQTRVTGRSFIQQKRDISGRLSTYTERKYKINYTFKDIKGWSNSGLASLSTSLGLDTTDKKLLDPYKSKMEVALIEPSSRISLL